MNTRDFDRLYRKNFSKMVTSLVTYFGFSNIALAEDLVQDTFVTAVEKWKEEMPENPEAWIYKVCKHKAINYLHKKSVKVTDRLGYGKIVIDEEYRVGQVFLPEEIEDNQLRLFFACCHPSFSDRSQVILTLRMIAGFKLGEISRALGSSVEAVKKNLTRTKGKIREERIQLRVPFLLKSRQRLQNVHKVLYLIFNEGYSASSGERLIRYDLCLEAIRLVRTLLKMSEIHTRETEALLALMLFNIARFPARQCAEGSIIDLENQDRTLWDKEAIRAGFYYLSASRKGQALSSYHLEAAIASLHCSVSRFEDTDWCAIVKLYRLLVKLKPSPFVKLGQQIALSYCSGPDEAIQGLISESLSVPLQDYYLYHVALGKMYLRKESFDEARLSFGRGLGLARQSTERTYIRSLMAKVGL